MFDLTFTKNWPDIQQEHSCNSKAHFCACNSYHISCYSQNYVHIIDTCLYVAVSCLPYLAFQLALVTTLSCSRHFSRNFHRERRHILKKCHHSLLNVCKVWSLRVDAWRFVQPTMKVGLKFLQLCSLSLKCLHTEHFNIATYSWSTVLHNNHLTVLNTLPFSAIHFSTAVAVIITLFCWRATIRLAFVQVFFLNKCTIVQTNANWPEIVWLLDVIDSTAACTEDTAKVRNWQSPN